MLGEIIDEGTFERNGVDFDVGIVVLAVFEMNASGQKTPIHLNAIGS